MIQENVSLQYRNVVAKKYKIHYSKISSCLNEFVNTLKARKMKLTGEMFYSTLDITKNAEIEIEFFVSVLMKTSLPDDTYRFYSYYQIDNMISEVIKENFETEVEMAYAKLLQYISNNKKEMISPFYNEVHRYEEKIFLVVKVATTEKVGT